MWIELIGGRPSMMDFDAMKFSMNNDKKLWKFKWMLLKNDTILEG